MKNLLTTILFFLLSTVAIMAQSAGRALTKGNENYAQKHFSQSEANYRIASSKSTNKTVSNYNLGNSLYRQKRNKEAITTFNRAISEAKTKEDKHQAYHNLGNAYMAIKNYKAAEEAYKNALRNNPKDDQTRYNYAVAKKLNEENPQEDNQDQNQDNKDQENKDQDQNKDQENQDQENKDQDKDDNKDQNDKNKDNKDDKNEKDNKDNKPDPQQQKQQQSKEQMDRILDAINRDEQAVQQRLINKDKKGEPKGATTERKKDW